TNRSGAPRNDTKRTPWWKKYGVRIFPDKPVT
ncbi:hypothetical protein CCACVL1_01338, partial [Corchorus capsularis]